MIFLYFSVKIHDLAEMKEIYAIITIEDAGGIVKWCFYLVTIKEK